MPVSEPEHEEDDVRFLALHGVHGPDVVIEEIFRGVAELAADEPSAGADHITERAQHVDPFEADVAAQMQPSQDARHGVALGGNPFALTRTGHVDPADRGIRGRSRSRRTARRYSAAPTEPASRPGSAARRNTRC